MSALRKRSFRTHQFLYPSGETYISDVSGRTGVAADALSVAGWKIPPANTQRHFSHLVTAMITTRCAWLKAANHL